MGTLLRRFVFGPGVDEPIAWYEGSGTAHRRWLIADERGSIIAVTDQSGAALNINAYDEYGRPASANVGRYQFTGQMWLPEAGVYSFKARDYIAALGRFAQTDPVLQAGGLNLYAYVGNDPVNATDPMGLQEQTSQNDLACPNVVGGGCVREVPVYSFSWPALILPWGNERNVGACLDCRPHHYEVDTPVCNTGISGCTISAVYQCLLKNPAPLEFSSTPVSTGSEANLFGFGRVVHITIPALHMVFNVTEEGHKLFPGVVMRQVVQESMGFGMTGIHIITNGYGNGQLATMNEASAQPMWNIQTLQVQGCLASGGGQ